jgi:hypothetical protein
MDLAFYDSQTGALVYCEQVAILDGRPKPLRRG